MFLHYETSSAVEDALTGSSPPGGVSREFLTVASSLLPGMQSGYSPGFPHSCCLSLPNPPPTSKAGLLCGISRDSRLFTSLAYWPSFTPVQPNGRSIHKKLPSVPSSLMLSMYWQLQSTLTKSLRDFFIYLSVNSIVQS